MPADHDPLDPILAEALAALRDRPPASDLWPAIAPRLTMRRPKGALLLRWPAALAAGIAIAVLSAAGTMLMLRSDGVVPPTALGTTTTAASTVAYTAADSTLTRAIGDLEAALHASMAKMDTASRAGIDRSLATLDRAIADAAARRSSTPDDPRAGQYLTATLRKKLEVLRTVSNLTARRS